MLKHEPSAQIPWQKTMLGLISLDDDFIVWSLSLSNEDQLRISVVEERIEHLWPSILELGFPLKSAL